VFLGFRHLLSGRGRKRYSLGSFKPTRSVTVHAIATNLSLVAHSWRTGRYSGDPADPATVIDRAA
jgi:hypothetical protein